MFLKSYSFLKGYQDNEINELNNQVSKENDPDEQLKLKKAVAIMVDTVKNKMFLNLNID
jgi:hypothetical protein